MGTTHIQNNKQIIFDMLEEVATESIANARNDYTYNEIDECYEEATKIANVVKTELENTLNKNTEHI